jgi:hypothetical protein
MASSLIININQSKMISSMKESKSKPNEHLTHPYVFLLKEGSAIHKNFLDYSLLLLQVGKPDVLYSPNTRQKSQVYPLVHLNRK